jgi:hypothetical protein
MKTRNAKMANGRVMGLVFMALGGLIALGGTMELMRTARFVDHATKVIGQIVTLGPDEGTEGVIHYPTFTFSDASGIVHTQRSSFGGPFSYLKGERVDILYDPAKPEHASIDSQMTLWSMPRGGIVFGLLFGGFGCFFWYYHKRVPESCKSD